MPAPLRLATADNAGRLPKRINFTVPALKAVKPPASGRAWLYDARTPHLALMIMPSGVKTFYYYAKVRGRPQRIRLGAFPEIGIDTARDEAAKLAGKVATGIDPAQERRSLKATMTLGELFAYYLETHAKLHKKSWAHDQAQVDRYLNGWLGRRVDAIGPNDVQALHARIGQKHGHYAANRLLALLSKMFNSARLENPARGIRKFREHSRDRFIQPDEMPRFLAALDEEPNPTIRDFLYVLLLTGARRGNVMAMRWEDVNLDAATWQIRDTKAGEPQTVALAPPAVELLRRRLTDRKDGCPWVFPAHHGDSGHLTSPKTAWAALLKRAGLADLRMHDLRRTVGSWAAALGASLPAIGKALGHKQAQTTAIYARLNLDPVRALMNDTTAAMLGTKNA